MNQSWPSWATQQPHQQPPQVPPGIAIGRYVATTGDAEVATLSRRVEELTKRLDESNERCRALHATLTMAAAHIESAEQAVRWIGSCSSMSANALSALVAAIDSDREMLPKLSVGGLQQPEQQPQQQQQQQQLPPADQLQQVAVALAKSIGQQQQPPQKKQKTEEPAPVPRAHPVREITKERLKETAWDLQQPYMTVRSIWLSGVPRSMAEDVAAHFDRFGSVESFIHFCGSDVAVVVFEDERATRVSVIEDGLDNGSGSGGSGRDRRFPWWSSQPSSSILITGWVGSFRGLETMLLPYIGRGESVSAATQIKASMSRQTASVNMPSVSSAILALIGLTSLELNRVVTFCSREDVDRQDPLSLAPQPQPQPLAPPPSPPPKIDQRYQGTTRSELRLLKELGPIIPGRMSLDLIRRRAKIYRNILSNTPKNIITALGKQLKVMVGQFGRTPEEVGSHLEALCVLAERTIAAAGGVDEDPDVLEDRFRSIVHIADPREAIEELQRSHRH